MSELKLIKQKAVSVLLMSAVCLATTVALIYVLSHPEFLGTIKNMQWMGVIFLATIVLGSGGLSSFYLLGSEEKYYVISHLIFNKPGARVRVIDYNNLIVVKIEDRAWSFHYDLDKIRKLKAMPVYFTYDRKKKFCGMKPLPHYKTKKEK